MKATSSLLDFFTIGLGPSCAHSVLPMRAAARFCDSLVREGHASKVHRVKVRIGGSCASSANITHVRTALLLGLEGGTPEKVEVDAIPAHLTGIRGMKSLRLPLGRVVVFDESADIFSHEEAEDGIQFTALDHAGNSLLDLQQSDSRAKLTFPIQSGSELASLSRASGHDISTLMMRQEGDLRSAKETRESLRRIWQTMKQSVERGCARDDKPGSCRARRLNRDLIASPFSSLSDPLAVLDWVGLWAIAVSEENAAGGRVVAVPTNETCGILPAVLHYLVRVNEGREEERVMRFLLTAGAIAMICAGPAFGAGVETSLGCAMASAAMCDALGGNTPQVITAAALALESHRGTRFTPAEFPAIGEPNAIAAVTAIHTARLALRTPQPDAGLLDRVVGHLRQSAVRQTANQRMALSA